MHIEEYGKENDSTIVMLHGANFVHCFGRQYTLAGSYHIVVPHIMGFGNEAERVFNADECISELTELIRSYQKKSASGGVLSGCAACVPADLGASGALLCGDHRQPVA